MTIWDKLIGKKISRYCSFVHKLVFEVLSCLINTKITVDAAISLAGNLQEATCSDCLLCVRFSLEHPPFSTAVVGTAAAAAGVSTPGYAIILSLPALRAAPSNYIMRTHGSACRKRAPGMMQLINWNGQNGWKHLPLKNNRLRLLLFCMKHLGEFSASCFSSIRSTINCKKG